MALHQGPPPWPAPDQVGDRIAAAGLPALSAEGHAVHWHAHLSVFVDGRSQPVPADLGVDHDVRLIAPLHTHGDGGILHVEANEELVVTLAHVFALWGVRLTDSCLAGYCSPETPVEVHVNGEVQQAPAPQVTISGGDTVAVVIGTPPATVPDGYDCSTAPENERRLCAGGRLA